MHMCPIQGGCSFSEKDSIARGYHIYKKNRRPVVREEFTLITEYDNKHDKDAVAVRNDGYIVEHMPCLVSKVSRLMGDPVLIQDPASIKRFAQITPNL